MNDLVEALAKISEQQHIIAIRRGLLLCMPIVVIGSFALVVNNLPLPWYQELMTYFLGSYWKDIGQSIWNGSLGIMSILLVFTISACLSERHPLVINGKTHPYMAPLVSFSCLLIIMQPITYNQLIGIPFRWIGIGGLFLAVATSLIASEIFLRLCTIKKFTISMFCDEADPIIAQPLACIMPVLLTMSMFAFAKAGMNTINIDDIHQYVVSQISFFFVHMENTLTTAIIYDVWVHTLWFFGMHGSDILEPVMRNFYGPAGESNMAAVLSGGETATFTDTFFNSFVLIGGSGSTLCTIIALLLLVRRGNVSRLAKLSILPAIFNINELLLFGLPIVLNPIYLIPFIIVPVTLTLVTFTAMTLGLVPVTTNSIAWTTPPFLSGYLATGSWKGAALQVLNLSIGTIIYLPFVKLAEKQKRLEIVQAFSRFLGEVEAVNPALSHRFLARQDNIGNLARVIAHDLKDGLTNNDFSLEYQPQVNSNNQVIGTEALLRWSHKLYGRVPPPLIIAVAEESEMIEDIGLWVFTKACCQLKDWKKAGINGIRMSVNVSVTQLYCKNLAENIKKVITENNLAPDEIEIEITENIALNNDTRIYETLNKLHKMGIRIAIDDFGMGHSSILYIKNFPISTLKIDRSLIHDVILDKNCQEIIFSITSLCSSLDIEVVAEYVETAEQRDKLKQLGCVLYQGYLYSPALPPQNITDYLQRESLHQKS